MIQIPGAVDQTLVPVDVSVLLVAITRTGEPVGNLVFVRRIGDQEYPLGPVTYLALLAEVEFGGNGADQRVGQPTVAGGTRPVECNPEVWPQFAQTSHTFDLGGTDG